LSVPDEGYYVPDEDYYVPDEGYYVPDEDSLTRKPTKQFEKHITQVKVNPNNIGGVMVNVLEGHITCFSHYYGVLTPLNQWWKNL
jgi:hypothetical protein